jgi:tetratricopeptide (TPR) repeat protein
MESEHVFDTATASIIRSAMSTAQFGRIDEACAIARRGLDQGGDPAPLHALLGSLLVGSGDFGAALPHLLKANAKLRSDPIVARNLASALVASERYSEVRPLVTEELCRRDQSCDLLRLRGYAAQMAGDVAAAIADYELVVAAHPSDQGTWNNLGNARESLNDVPGAVAALSRAAELDPRTIATRLNLALVLRLAGDLVGAELHLKRIVEDFPEDVTAFQYLFGVLKELGRDADAKHVLRSAIDRAPTHAGMRVALGREQLLAFEIAEARLTFRLVLEFEPSNLHAFLGLADAAEREDPAQLPNLHSEAKASGIDSNGEKLIRALAAWRERRYRDGAAALAGIPDDFDPIRRWHLHGQLLDGLGHYDRAFDAFSRMNDALAREPTKPLLRAARLRERLRGQLGRMTPAWLDEWAPPIAPDSPAPVFLLGFPRSGTTLLDTMLMGHPDVLVMEERPVLHRLRLEAGGFDAIAGMGEEQVRRARARYFELAADDCGELDGRLLVDKSPLHLHNVAHIRRLFPDARFILALRHPADAVLSCFMAKFVMNDSMANFTSIETAAQFYDLSFSMWERALELFPVNALTVRYEELVEAPEPVMRPLAEALGLEWSPRMLDHRRTAVERGVISSASYAQVTQPLYRSSIGRWEHYRDALEPVLPVLRPWIARHGYRAD